MQTEEQLRNEAISQVAQKMMAAARTAPKGRGVDTIHIALANAEDIAQISAEMKQQVAANSWPAFFGRDADNILQAPYMVLMGTKISPLRLSPCGLCGYASCSEKELHPDSPCAFNTGDLGIAIGSAVSVAMDNRIDNRIMYTVGKAVQRMSIFPEAVKIIYGIPLSVSAKNPFFDRK